MKTRELISYLGNTPVFNSSQAEVFTLNKGFNAENSAFVRCSDGFVVGADPTKVRKGDSLKEHHVYGEGYLYCSRPGYVFATLKDGKRGWSMPWQVAEGHYRMARVSRGEVKVPPRSEYLVVMDSYEDLEGWLSEIIDVFVNVDQEDGEVSIHIQREDPNPKAKEVSLGAFIHNGEPVGVSAIPFKGLQSMLKQLFSGYGACQSLLADGFEGEMKSLPYGATYCISDGSSFIIDSKGQFSFAEMSFEETAVAILEDHHPELIPGGRPAILLEDGKYLLSLEGRYVVAKQEYKQQWKEYGITSLQFGDYSDLVPSLRSGETTKEWWDKMAAEREVVSLRYVVDSLSLGKELSEAETTLLNYPKATRYGIEQLREFRVKAPYAWYGRRKECLFNSPHPNETAVYDYIRSAAKEGDLEVLHELMCTPYKTEGLLWRSYAFEGGRMLGDFVHHAIEAGHDIEKMFIEACNFDESRFIGPDFINSLLVYWIEESHVGWHPHNNYPWLEKRNYQGDLQWWFAENASMAEYKPVRVSEEEAAVLVQRLASERAQKG